MALSQPVPGLERAEYQLLRIEKASAGRPALRAAHSAAERPLSLLHVRHQSARQHQQRFVSYVCITISARQAQLCTHNLFSSSMISSAQLQLRMERLQHIPHYMLWRWHSEALDMGAQQSLERHH